MQMSGYSPPARRVSPARILPGEGFTLLEILVVLVLAGLLAGIVLPRFQDIAASLEVANQRKDLHITLEGLGYQAYTSGKPITLSGTYPRHEPASALPVDPPVSLPAGWRLEVKAPVQFAVTGVCSGGRLSLSAPDRSAETFQMKSPRCLLEQDSAS